MLMWNDSYLSIVKVLIEDQENILSKDLLNIPSNRHSLYKVFYANSNKSYKVICFIANNNQRLKNDLKFSYELDSLDREKVVELISSLENIDSDYVSNNYWYYTINKVDQTDLDDSFGVIYIHK